MKRFSLLLLTLVATVASAQTYDEAGLKAFHAEREKALLADNGWFTVAGLHFLNPGENKFGSDPLNDIVLEFADVPKQAGVITMNGNTVTIKAADGQTLTYNGKPVKEGPLRLSERGRPADLITYKSTTFFLHFSGPRLAIRVRDQNAPLRKNFSGLKWYPANPAMKVTGTFTPLATPKVVQAPTILGDLEPFTVPGTRVGHDRRQDREHGGVEVRRSPVVRVPRSDQRRCDVSVRAIPLHRRRRQRRQGDARFQSRAESAVRLQPVDHVPAAAVGQQAAGAHRGG